MFIRLILDLLNIEAGQSLLPGFPPGAGSIPAIQIAFRVQVCPEQDRDQARQGTVVVKSSLAGLLANALGQ